VSQRTLEICCNVESVTVDVYSLEILCGSPNVRDWLLLDYATVELRYAELGIDCFIETPWAYSQEPKLPISQRQIRIDVRNRILIVLATTIRVGLGSHSQTKRVLWYKVIVLRMWMDAFSGVFQSSANQCC
jgi:hypothetical protein